MYKYYDIIIIESEVIGMMNYYTQFEWLCKAVCDGEMTVEEAEEIAVGILMDI